LKSQKGPAANGKPSANVDLSNALKQLKDYEVELTHYRTIKRTYDNSDEIVE
jgi:hypothetical protein